VATSTVVVVEDRGGRVNPLRLLGHRGARGEAPENTIVSFGRALSDGATALELDVHLSIDGEVVVCHDDDFVRMGDDPRLVTAMAWADIARVDVGRGFVADDGSRPYAGRGCHPPRLGDVLRAFPGVPVNIDLKDRDPALRRAALDVVSAAHATGRVVLASFWDEVVLALLADGWPHPVGLPRNAVRALRLTPLVIGKRLLRPYLQRPGHRVQIPPKVGRIALDGEDFIAKCHGLGFVVDYWVINELAQAQSLIARGADGLITDFPARLRGLVPSPFSSVSSASSSS
jgi:glycerophosphoryl diester phosphodiesterase